MNYWAQVDAQFRGQVRKLARNRRLLELQLAECPDDPSEHPTIGSPAAARNGDRRPFLQQGLQARIGLLFGLRRLVLG